MKIWIYVFFSREWRLLQLGSTWRWHDTPNRAKTWTYFWTITWCSQHTPLAKWTGAVYFRLEIKYVQSHACAYVPNLKIEMVWNGKTLSNLGIFCVSLGKMANIWTSDLLGKFAKMHGGNLRVAMDYRPIQGE